MGNRFLAPETAKVAELLSHSVPLLADLPIASLVRIRREERNAFITYRHSLTKAIRQGLKPGVSLTEGEARELFKSELQPRIDGLKQFARSHRRSELAKASGKAFISAVIGFGVAHSGQPLGAAVALGYAAKTVEHTLDALRVPEELKNSDVYYLFRLDREVST